MILERAEMDVSMWKSEKEGGFLDRIFRNDYNIYIGSEMRMNGQGEHSNSEETQTKVSRLRNDI